MNLESSAISEYKNKICIANFALCIIFVFFGYADVDFNIKTTFGMVMVTLGPILWNKWMYEGLFNSRAGNPAISYRAFLWIGLLGVCAFLLVLLISFTRGTL